MDPGASSRKRQRVGGDANGSVNRAQGIASNIEVVPARDVPRRIGTSRVVPRTPSPLCGVGGVFCWSLKMVVTQEQGAKASTPDASRRVFSGIQPTGEFHLGNYL